MASVKNSFQVTSGKGAGAGLAKGKGKAKLQAVPVPITEAVTDDERQAERLKQFDFESVRAVV
jgi:hypothetical protein